MTAREFLNLVAILESIDEVPGMPASFSSSGPWRSRMFMAASDKVRFLQRADDATRDAIWAEVERRIGRGENAPALAQKE